MNHPLPFPAVRRSARFSFRQQCLIGLMLLSFLAANAQTDWTVRPQTPDMPLEDIAYGAGRYVAVGGEVGGIIRAWDDNTSWTTVFADQFSPGLYGIVYAAGKFVTVGLSGTVRTSTDGVNWTAQVSGTTKNLFGVTYGGGQFMAVGWEGTAITSPDGVIWTTRTTGTTTDFDAVTYGGGQFVIVGDGLIRTTPNGMIWTARTSGTSKRLASVTVCKSGLFVAVGESSAIVTSPDGITWTPRSAPGFGDLLGGVACDLATGQFVAVSNHENEVLTSPDGITWSLTYSGTQLRLSGVNHVNGQFVAVGEYGTVRSSTNGTAWKPLTITLDLEFKAAAYGNGHYVAVGGYPFINHPAIGTAAAYSTDGINYSLSSTEPFIGAGGGFYDVVFGNGKFVAVGTNAIIQTSVDGSLWFTQYSSLGETLNGIAYGGGQFVAVGAGLTARSTDGTTWTTNFTQSANLYNGITYAQGQFVAVGYQGGIGTSSDGAIWTPRTSGITKDLKSIVYGNGLYVASGLGGIAIKSVDGITWTTIPPFTVSDLNHITFDNGQFVTVGEDSEIFISPNGINWTKRIPMGTDGFKLNGIGYANGLFVAVGEGATIATSPDNGWQPPVNQAPNLANSIPDQAATIGQLFSYGIPANTFTDPNGDVLTLSASGLPNGLSLNGSTISGTPTTQGASTVTITATDPGNLAVSTQFTITVTPLNPGNFAITGVTTVSCQAVAGEPNRRSLSFTPHYAGTNGQPISFAVANETLPTTNPGPYTMWLYIDNPAIILKSTQQGTPGEASYTYNWLAVCNGVPPPVNQPPLAPIIANASGMVGQVFSQSIPPFTDPEGQSLTYSITGVPPGLLVVDGGNMVGPPTTAGVYPITVTATDPGGLSASATYTLTINPAGGNPGDFDLTGVTGVNCVVVSPTKRSLSFTPSYTNTNGQPISFSVVNELATTTNPGPYTLTLYTDNPTITLKATQQGTPGQVSFAYNWLAVCNNANARLGVEVQTELAVRVLGNPVGHTVSVEVLGAEGGALSLSLVDMTGRVVARRTTQKAQETEPFSIDVSSQPAGMLLLRVNTASETKTIHLLKNE